MRVPEGWAGRVWGPHDEVKSLLGERGSGRVLTATGRVGAGAGDPFLRGASRLSGLGEGMQRGQEGEEVIPG